MGPKQRKSPRPPLSHHPSQSSVDVPVHVKNSVKAAQGNRCWLCNQKAHKRHRPLEIAHILPQASHQRIHFLNNHKSGRTQLSNIHDAANLMALCKICHYAFGSGEWTFLPRDLATWVQAAEADPEKNFIPEWNSKRDIVFRRYRLVDDPDSEASRDKHFKSAFTNELFKVWPGEIGVAILGNQILTNLALPDELEDVDKEFTKLREIWKRYKSPCSNQECLICRPEGDDNEDMNHMDRPEDNDNDNDGNEGGKGGNYQKSGRRSLRNRLEKLSRPSRRYETRSHTISHANHSMRATTHSHSPRIRNTSRRSKHNKSVLYDKSVPYSHREGYTWANTTANELMARWQGLPYIKQADGQIIITHPILS
jgi:HNH endonuclease